MLELENILIRQGAFSLAADWTIARGTMLAVIGPSGGGKSTLLSLIAGFLEPTRGRVLIGGKDMAGTAPGQRPVSLLFQEHNLFPHLTVGQNVGLGLRPDLRLDDAAWGKVGSSLERVGLGGFQSRRPADLSGGQRQRVALARALLRDKPLLLLDEPFAALGPRMRVGMLDLVNEIVTTGGLTLVMVTHDPKDAQRIADQTSLVAGGRVSPPVDTAEFFANPPQALTDYL